MKWSTRGCLLLPVPQFDALFEVDLGLAMESQVPATCVMSLKEECRVLMSFDVLVMVV